MNQVVVPELHYAPDNASLIVRLALEEMEVDYRTVLVDRTSAEQQADAYRKLNPFGLIPVCIIAGEPVFETAAILLVLSEHFGKLAPQAGEPHRAHFLKWLFALSNGLHGELRQLFYPEKYIGEGSANEALHRELTRQRLHERTRIFEALYSAEAEPFLYGRDPGVIDIYLAVCLRWAQLYPMRAPGQLDIGDYPAIEKMMLALEARPAIARGCAAEGIPSPWFTRPDYART